MTLALILFALCGPALALSGAEKALRAVDNEWLRDGEFDDRDGYEALLKRKEAIAKAYFDKLEEAQ